MKNIIFSSYGVIVLIILVLFGLSAYYAYGTFTSIDDIQSKIIELYTWGNAQNQFATAGVSLWLLGVGTYLAKDLPYKMWRFIVKQATVTLTLNNCDDVYEEFLIWYQKTGRSKKSRTLVAQDAFEAGSNSGYGGITVGRAGRGTQMSSGYGTHFFIYGGKIFSWTRTEKEAAQTKQTKESIELVTIGRSQAQFHDLLDEVTVTVEESDITHIYKWSADQEYWNRQGEQAARKFDSVILPQKTKDEITQHLDTFRDEREWYIENGIPYRTGIMLYGIPGGGKTSLVRGICQRLNKPLYVISLSSTAMTTLEEAFSEMPRDCVCLMEDIDSYAATITRDAQSTNEGLPTLLNAIDGIAASDGRILIATTNNIEMLDGALVRKGRFNLSINIDYLTDPCFRQFFTNFYADYVVPKDVAWREDMSPATLQALIIDNREDPDFVLGECITQA